MQTKVIDNKLKIIDDVPSSAVEMAVKEKVFGHDRVSLWQLIFGIWALTRFSSVPEESSAPGAYCGRSKAGVKASLQYQEDQQGSLQGDPQEDCSKGLVHNIQIIPWEKLLKHSVAGMSQQIWRDQPVED